MTQPLCGIGLAALELLGREANDLTHSLSRRTGETRVSVLHPACRLTKVLGTLFLMDAGACPNPPMRPRVTDITFTLCVAGILTFAGLCGADTQAPSPVAAD